MPVIQPSITITGSAEFPSSEYVNFSESQASNYSHTINILTVTPPTIEFVQNVKRRYYYYVNGYTTTVTFYGASGLFISRESIGYYNGSSSGDNCPVFNITLDGTYNISTTLPNGEYDVWMAVGVGQGANAILFTMPSTSPIYGCVNSVIHGSFTVSNGVGTWVPDITEFQQSAFYGTSSTQTQATLVPYIVMGRA